MKPINGSEHLLAAGDPGELYGLPDLPFVPAIRVVGPHELVFASGVLGPPTADDPDTSIEAEARRAYRNLERVLDAAGATLADIVSMTKFVKDMERHNDAIGQITVSALPHLVTTTTVEISRLVPHDLNFEVNAIAAVPTHRSREPRAT